MAATDRFTSQFKTTPYWWEAAPRPQPAELPVPRQIDAAIVGSGFTGLNAALLLARAGRSVVVFEAGVLGQGASTRNAGFVGRTLKHHFGHLLKKLGADRAVAIYREMQAAFDAVREVVETEDIDCGFRIGGRYIPAPSPFHYEDLSAEFEAQRRHLGVEFEMVPRAQQRRELASDRYFGGAVVPDLASIHPGLYHAGLLERVRAAGISLLPSTPVTRIASEGPHRLRVATARGDCVARDVLIATNGYTDDTLPWLQRRLVPFDAYMIATEELAPEVIARVLPTDRTCIDWNRDAAFVRRSPDSRHILFGALTGTRPEPPRAKAERLFAWLAEMLPDLRGVRIGHSWTGRCAATFDMYPHLGRRDGIHYAVGYCFAGIPMGTYLGRKAALAILEAPEARTVFADRGFPTLPLYSGRSWFVPQVMRAYRWLDGRDARRPAGKHREKTTAAEGSAHAAQG